MKYKLLFISLFLFSSLKFWSQSLPELRLIFPEKYTYISQNIFSNDGRYLLIKNNNSLIVYSIEDFKKVYKIPLDFGSYFYIKNNRIYVENFIFPEYSIFDWFTGELIGSDTKEIRDYFNIQNTKLKDWDEYGRLAMILPDPKITTWELENNNVVYWKISNIHGDSILNDILIKGSIENETYKFQCSLNKSYFDIFLDEKGSENPIPRILSNRYGDIFLFSKNSVLKLKYANNEFRQEQLLTLQKDDQIIGSVKSDIIIRSGNEFIGYDLNSLRIIDSLPEVFVDYDFAQQNNGYLNGNFKSVFFKRTDLFTNYSADSSLYELRSYSKDSMITFNQKPRLIKYNSNRDYFFLIKNGNTYSVFDWNQKLLWNPYEDSTLYEQIQLSEDGRSLLAEFKDEYYLVDLKSQSRVKLPISQTVSTSKEQFNKGIDVVLNLNSFDFNCSVFDLDHFNLNLLSKKRSEFSDCYLAEGAPIMIGVDTVRKRIKIFDFYKGDSLEYSHIELFTSPLKKVLVENGYFIFVLEDNVLVISEKERKILIDLNRELELKGISET